MSRLSLKPGGAPGVWSLRFPVRSRGMAENAGERWLADVTEVPDSDLRAIRATINEYFEAKEPVAEKTKWNRWPLVVLAGTVSGLLVGVAMLGTLYHVAHMPYPPTSTGGVVDSLCMRPEVECATPIRYVHPQAGVPHQERETYSELNESRLEEK